MSGRAVRLELRVDRVGVDDDEADRLVRALCKAIREADLEGVQEEQRIGVMPAGARGDAFTIGALALVLAPELAPVLLDHLLQIVRAWCARPGARPVKISLKVGQREISAEYDATQVTSAEVQRAVKDLSAALKDET